MSSERMSREQRNALLTVQRIAEAVIAVVNETPAGAPGGVLYAALMRHMSIEQFQSLMRALVGAERITRRGDLYFPRSGQ